MVQRVFMRQDLSTLPEWARLAVARLTKKLVATEAENVRLRRALEVRISGAWSQGHERCDGRGWIVSRKGRLPKFSRCAGCVECSK